MIHIVGYSLLMHTVPVKTHRKFCSNYLQVADMFNQFFIVYNTFICEIIGYAKKELRRSL